MKNTDPATLHSQHALLAAISRAQSLFIGSREARPAFDELLTDILQLTDSAYGFFGEVLYTADHAPYLKTHAITNIAWDDTTRRFYDECAPTGMLFTKLHTLFGSVLTSRRPVIANDPATDQRRGGLPPGHPPLNAFLGMPLYAGDQFVGMVGLANRPAGYDAQLMEFLQPLMNTAAHLLLAWRNHEQRLRAENLLRDTATTLRAVLDTVLDGIITISEFGIVESFNPAAEKLFGYRAIEVIGNNVSMLMPDPYRSEHDQYLGNYLRSGQRRIIGIGREATGQRKDGSQFPMELAVSEMFVAGRRMFTGLVHDITARKKHEAELIHAREIAEQASRAKSEFLSSMSHEFRTPLNSIIGFAQLMESDPVPLPQAQLENLKYVLQSGYTLLGLVNDLLDLSRIEAGRVPLSLEPVPLDEVIASAAQVLPPFLKKYDVTLSVADMPAGISGVFADYIRAKQVMLNLLTNAAKYNNKGGRIDVTCEARDDFVRINVRDTGIGIPAEKQQQIFISFARLGRENSTIEGSGIGLVISKKLVEMMNGRIGFSSEPGKGSTFWVELPAAPMSVPQKIANAPWATAPVNTTERPYTILYVEDNPANLRFMERLIGSRVNTRLISAHEPQLGIELATAHCPDLILLDINLPGIDGYEVLQRLRVHGKTHDIPVIAVTANAMPRDVERGTAAGFDGYVTKPINVPQFLQLVSDTLHHRSDHHLN